MPMTHKEFCCWLEGFFMRGGQRPTDDHWHEIGKRLQKTMNPEAVDGPSPTSEGGKDRNPEKEPLTASKLEFIRAKAVVHTKNGLLGESLDEFAKRYGLKVLTTEEFNNLNWKAHEESQYPRDLFPPIRTTLAAR